MASVQFVISVCYKGKMEFTFSKVVWLCPVFQPGQFQLEIRFPVSQIDQLKRAVCGFFFTYRFDSQRFFVKSKAFFQIQYIKIKVCKFSAYIYLLFCIFFIFFVFSIPVFSIPVYIFYFTFLSRLVLPLPAVSLSSLSSPGYGEA